MAGTLTDQVYERIKMDLMLRKLQPGQKLNYKSLAKAYGLSETPIKQALNRLVADGIVLIEPNKGMWIKRYSKYEIEDIVDARLMFELYNAERIYGTVNGNLRVQRMLQENLKRHAKIAEQYDPENIQCYIDAMEIDDEFHKLLMYCTGNKTIIDLYGKLKAFVFVYHTFGLQSRERILRNVREHAKIFECLISDNVESVRRAIIDHNASSKWNTVQMFQIENEREDCNASYAHSK